MSSLKIVLFVAVTVVCMHYCCCTTIDAETNFLHAADILDIPFVTTITSTQPYVDEEDKSSTSKYVFQRMHPTFKYLKLYRKNNVHLTDFQNGMLQTHNDFRMSVGLPPLQWSVELSDFAKKHIVEEDAIFQCRGQQSSPSLRQQVGKFQNVGENMYISRQSPTPQHVVETWFSEVNCYNYGPTADTCTSNCNRDFSVNHFTQMMWATTTHMGCEMHHCTNCVGIDCAAYYVSCNYGSTVVPYGGNAVGVVPFDHTVAYQLNLKTCSPFHFVAPTYPISIASSFSSTGKNSYSFYDPFAAQLKHVKQEETIDQLLQVPVGISQNQEITEELTESLCSPYFLRFLNQQVEDAPSSYTYSLNTSPLVVQNVQVVGLNSYQNELRVKDLQRQIHEYAQRVICLSKYLPSSAVQYAQMQFHIFHAEVIQATLTILKKLIKHNEIALKQLETSLSVSRSVANQSTIQFVHEILRKNTDDLQELMEQNLMTLHEIIQRSTNSIKIVEHALMNNIKFLGKHLKNVTLITTKMLPNSNEQSATVTVQQVRKLFNFQTISLEQLLIDSIQALIVNQSGSTVSVQQAFLTMQRNGVNNLASPQKNTLKNLQRMILSAPFRRVITQLQKRIVLENINVLNLLNQNNDVLQNMIAATLPAVHLTQGIQMLKELVQENVLQLAQLRDDNLRTMEVMAQGLFQEKDVVAIKKFLQNTVSLLQSILKSNAEFYSIINVSTPNELLNFATVTLRTNVSFLQQLVDQNLKVIQIQNALQEIPGQAIVEKAINIMTSPFDKQGFQEYASKVQDLNKDVIQYSFQTRQQQQDLIDQLTAELDNSLSGGLLPKYDYLSGVKVTEQIATVQPVQIQEGTGSLIDKITTAVGSVLTSSKLQFDLNERQIVEKTDSSGKSQKSDIYLFKVAQPVNNDSYKRNFKPKDFLIRETVFSHQFYNTKYRCDLQCLQKLVNKIVSKCEPKNFAEDATIVLTNTVGNTQSNDYVQSNGNSQLCVSEAVEESIQEQQTDEFFMRLAELLNNLQLVNQLNDVLQNFSLSTSKDYLSIEQVLQLVVSQYLRQKQVLQQRQTQSLAEKLVKMFENLSYERSQYSSHDIREKTQAVFFQHFKQQVQEDTQHIVSRLTEFLEQSQKFYPLAIHQIAEQVSLQNQQQRQRQTKDTIDDLTNVFYTLLLNKESQLSVQEAVQQKLYSLQSEENQREQYQAQAIVEQLTAANLFDGSVFKYSEVMRLTPTNVHQLLKQTEHMLQQKEKEIQLQVQQQLQLLQLQNQQLQGQKVQSLQQAEQTEGQTERNGQKTQKDEDSKQALHDVKQKQLQVGQQLQLLQFQNQQLQGEKVQPLQQVEQDQAHRNGKKLQQIEDSKQILNSLKNSAKQHEEENLEKLQQSEEQYEQRNQHTQHKLRQSYTENKQPSQFEDLNVHFQSSQHAVESQPQVTVSTTLLQKIRSAIEKVLWENGTHDANIPVEKYTQNLDNLPVATPATIEL